MRIRITTTPALAALLIVLALASAAPAAAADDGAPIDINTATAAELTALPGVGPAIAQRIVEFREEHGPYRAVEDLLKVRGIGEKALERIKGRVTVGRAR